METSEKSPGEVVIRAAVSDDIVDILNMVRELAEFEKLSHQVVASEDDYRESLFGDRPTAEALVAEGENGLVGYAIFFSTFSTFVGKAGIWLEDLYVRPEARKQGLGKRLLKEVGKVAEKRGAGRYEWSVLDWNRNAIDLYTRMGGEILEEWRIVRLDRDGIETLPHR